MSLPSTDAGPAVSQERYDGVTIVFHWITALLVAVLFGMTLIWNSRELRHQLETLHVSLGIALAAVLIGRLLWRALAGRRLGGTGAPITDIASRLVHWLLYVLLAAQVGLGFGLRWLQGETFSFFGLFSIPSPIASDRALAHQFEDIHNLAAWALVIVAGAHAVAAIYHRVVLKDGVMKRMLPLGG